MLWKRKVPNNHGSFTSSAERMVTGEGFKMISYFSAIGEMILRMALKRGDFCFSFVKKN